MKGLMMWSSRRELPISRPSGMAIDGREQPGGKDPREAIGGVDGELAVAREMDEGARHVERRRQERSIGLRHRDDKLPDQHDDDAGEDERQDLGKGLGHAGATRYAPPFTRAVSSLVENNAHRISYLLGPVSMQIFSLPFTSCRALVANDASILGESSACRIFASLRKAV